MRFCADGKSIDIMREADWGPMTEFKVQSLHASTSEAITNNVRVEVESRFAPDRSQTFENEWVFIYTVRITNEGDDTVQLLEPALDHHRCHRPHRGNPPAGRRRRAAGAAAGRVVSVLVELRAQHVDGRHARHLPDGDGGRRALRRRNRPLLAPRALHGPLDPELHNSTPRCNRPGVWLRYVPCTSTRLIQCRGAYTCHGRDRKSSGPAVVTKRERVASGIWWRRSRRPAAGTPPPARRRCRAAS